MCAIRVVAVSVALTTVRVALCPRPMFTVGGGWWNGTPGEKTDAKRDYHRRTRTFDITLLLFYTITCSAVEQSTPSDRLRRRFSIAGVARARAY